MKIAVTESNFIQAFHNVGRGNQFTPSALSALFGYYDDLDSECGTDTELDPIAICCDWSEYTAEEMADQFPELLEDVSDKDDINDWADAMNDAMNDTVIVTDCDTLLVSGS